MVLLQEFYATDLSHQNVCEKQWPNLFFWPGLLNMSLMGKCIYLIQCSQYFSHFGTCRKWSDYLWPSEGKQRNEDAGNAGCWPRLGLLQLPATHPQCVNCLGGSDVIDTELWLSLSSRTQDKKLHTGPSLYSVPTTETFTWWNLAHLCFTAALQKQLFSKKGALLPILWQSSS